MFKNRRRGKVNLTYIRDDSTRRVTFKKRNKGLFKKLDEISTLCDIKACAVVYNPDEGGNPILFPDDPFEVFNVITEFRKLSVTEQKRKMFDQEEYLKDRITKGKEQLSRLRMDNQERRLTQFMYEMLGDKTKSFDTLNGADLQELSKLIDRHLGEIEQHMENLGNGGVSALSLPPNHPLLAAVEPQQVPVGSDQNLGVVNPGNLIAGENGNSLLLDQWFFEGQHCGGNSNSIPFLGSDPNLGAM